MTRPDLVTMVLHGFLVQGASDLLMPWLFDLGSSTHRRSPATAGETNNPAGAGFFEAGLIDLIELPSRNKV